MFERKKCPNALSKIASRTGLDRLTSREREVLECLTEALAYKQIADRLNISLNTTRRHLSNIYRKLQAHSRTEVVVKYLRSQALRRHHPKM